MPPPATTHKKILIVEDEKDILQLVKLYLEKEGFRTVSAMTGTEGLRQVKAEHPDLIILDLMLPELDGLEVCKRIRLNQETALLPILMLTAKAEESDTVIGLELGADDYVTKPFNPRELRARVKAVLRRFDEGSPGVYRFGDLEADFDRAEVRRAGNPVDLTALEFRLLKVFIERRGRVLSRAQLIEAAWEPATHVSDRAVDTHVLHLRQKIEREPGRPELLHGVRGIGYRFDG